MTPFLRPAATAPRAGARGEPRPAHAWHGQDAAGVLQAQGVRAATGLDAAEAARRLARYGPNQLPSRRPRAPWRRWLAQFHNPLIYVLLAACAVTYALDDVVDAGVILLLVLVNAGIGFVQEGKAQKALDAVAALLASRAAVQRDGHWIECDAASLVPGDIVSLECGTQVPADLRLLHARNLQLDEAALTGESVPVEKRVHAASPEAPLAERHCMAYAGTLVSAGQGRGVVVATGVGTEIGRIGALVANLRPLATPLTRRLDQFARRITLYIVAGGAATMAFGVLVRDMPLLEVFLAVVGLAVAAVPEGLPAIVTVVLAIGTRGMARKNAIVRRLPAVETLGSVTVICSDKTGTLTRNAMTVTRAMLPLQTLEVGGTGYAPRGGFTHEGRDIDPHGHAALHELARCALLCNDARLHEDPAAGWQPVGDPTEAALLCLASKAGLDPAAEVAAAPRRDEIPFDPERRLMATLHASPDGPAVVMLKGAPERVLELCMQEPGGRPIDPAHWQQRIDAAAGDGQRVLALARRELPAGTLALHDEDLAPCFTLLGLVGLIDPPRDEAVAAVAECKAAGLQVKMITGDHARTAAAIARRLGLRADHVLTGDALEGMSDARLRRCAGNVDVFARASPQHKLRLIDALQASGELVAMTGDGANDAPALRSADIGVAMGRKGTDTAREAADLVLTDDNFATIVHAVRQGRVVFDNIKKALLFMLPTNGGEAGVILLAIFAGLALPVTAGQILWVNMVTAVTLALALAFEPAEPGVMARPPRAPAQPLVTGLLAARIGYLSLLMMATTFATFYGELARGNGLAVARTAAVNMLVVGELAYLFSVRHFTAPSFGRGAFRGNPMALWMSALLVACQLVFTYAPPMQRLFGSAPLDLQAWGVILALGSLSFAAVEIEKTLLRRRGVTRF